MRIGGEWPSPGLLDQRLERVDGGQGDEREAGAALAGDREVGQGEALAAARRAGLRRIDVFDLGAELAVAHAVAAGLARREARLLARLAVLLDDRGAHAGVAGRRRNPRRDRRDAALSAAGAAVALGRLAAVAGPADRVV